MLESGDVVDDCSDEEMGIFTHQATLIESKHFTSISNYCPFYIFMLSVCISK